MVNRKLCSIRIGFKLSALKFYSSSFGINVRLELEKRNVVSDREMKENKAHYANTLIQYNGHFMAIYENFQMKM